MLLTRLVEHAGRRDDLPPAFYRPRTIRWVIHLNEVGSPMTWRLGDLAGGDQPAGTSLAAPYIYRSGQRPPAVLLVDDLRYVLAYAGDKATEREAAEAVRRNEDYIALLARWRDSAPDDLVAQAVMAFFGKGLHRKVDVPPEAKPTDVVAVMVGADQWAHLRESAKAFWAQVARERKASAGTGICLVCGQVGPLLDTIPEAVKSGAIPTGGGRGRDAQLVSVNKPAQGRCGKIQLASAPVCDRCGSAAMSALNALLAADTSRYRTADSVMAWWLRRPQEFPWMDLLNNPQPDQVRSLLSSVNKPSLAPGAGGGDANEFYAVTLAANQSRVVVRDWLDVPLAEVEAHLGRWFADHQVTNYQGDKPQPSRLWLMAVSTGRWGSDSGQERYFPHSWRMAWNATCCSLPFMAPGRRAICSRTCCSASALTGASTTPARHCCAWP